MKKCDLSCYRKVNDSFNRKMVYHVGVDCGFFVEMNYMVDAMLWCLTHRVKFMLYSDDANFGTGVGWTEYFEPFCQEVHDDFHKKYNFHKLPSWLNIFKLCRSQRSLNPIAWKVKKTLMTLMGRAISYKAYGEKVLFAQDVPHEPEQNYCVPELGIDGDYLQAFAMIAGMIWNLRPELLQKKDVYKNEIALPAVYSGVQIRSGDKITETRLIDGKIMINRLGLLDGDNLFILTDDYRQFLNAKINYPNLQIFTLCSKDETGYNHKQFSQGDDKSKKNAISKLIISMDYLLNSYSFAGSITTGPSVFILKLRHGDPRVVAVDCCKDELPAVLRLPLVARTKISMSNLLREAPN